MYENLSKGVVKTIIVTGLIVTILGVLTCGGAERALTPEVRIDPRVELFSIIFRLAGNMEYNQRGVFPYVEDINNHFEAYKDHPAVAMAKQLSEESRIGFDAPMTLAVHVTNPPQLRERADFRKYPEMLDERWTTESARTFLAEARRFVKDTDFMSFLEEHKDLYSTYVKRAREFVGKEVDIGWFRPYFGKSVNGKFIITLAPNNGGPSYGPHFENPGQGTEYYCVLGLGHPNLDQDQIPTFPMHALVTIIHEFCHSFANPVVDDHQSELKSVAEKLFPLVQSSMRAQAYDNWLTMMRETFVRACVIRYLLVYKGEEAARAQLDRELVRKFVLVDRLNILLGGYEKQRDRYPSLDSFVPCIVESFYDLVEKPEEFDKIKQRLDGIAAERKAAARKRFEELKAHPEKLPKVVSTVPAFGGTDVNPALKEIRIEFDRSMNQSTLFIPIKNTEYPEFTGEFRWESNSTVFILGVKLEPNTEYGFGLNSELAQYFADEKGNPMLPVVIRFKTRKNPNP